MHAIVAPPDEPYRIGNGKLWDQVARKLGLELPSDYREFVEAYGSGSLAGFIQVYNPYSESPYSLLERIEKVCQVYRSLKSSEGDRQVPFPIHPDRPGLLPWAQNDVGNYMFWLTEGAPEKWPVVLSQGRSDKWERFDMGMLTFLIKALTHGLKSKIWPDDFPDPDSPIVFTPEKRKRQAKGKKG
jgi:hypothetical protein